MATLRGEIGRPVKAWITRAYRRKLDQSEVWSMPLDAWDRTPAHFRNWLSYQIGVAGIEHARRKLMDADHPLAHLDLPLDNLWVLSAPSIVFLYRLLERKRPLRIAEFGGGYSTAVFATYAARHPGPNGRVPHIVSVEHDAECLQVTRERLERLGLMKYVDLVHAPLAERDVLGERKVAFNPPDGSFAGDPFDFCLIDGPPEVIGRAPCLGLIAEHLAPGATILLDDGFRKSELAAWGSWRKRFPGRLRGSRMVLTDKGILLGTWSDSSSSSGPSNWPH